jgi:hypothetical protein
MGPEAALRDSLHHDHRIGASARDSIYNSLDVFDAIQDTITGCVVHRNGEYPTRYRVLHSVHSNFFAKHLAL